MTDPEAIGNALTGGILARAVELGAGERREGHTHETRCLNCGCALVGEYCHCCGQHAHVHRSIGAWWHDFVHSVLHLDGKFWRTMPLLAWRPGELTRRYAHGERARFISPLALFLFTVFLMFAVFTLIGGPFDGGPSGERVRQDLQQEVSSLRERVSTLEQERAELADSGRPTAEVEARLAEVEDDLQAIETARSVVVLPNNSPEGEGRTVNLREADLATGWPWLDSSVEKARTNPELLLYKVQANAYKFSWMLIPLSLPFVWVLFLHRRRYRSEFSGYDHLVFVTYSIAFMSIALVGVSLLERLGAGGLATIALLLVPPLHIYRQLRGAYGLSRGSALWRSAVLIVFATISLLLFVLLLLTIGTVS